MSAVLLTASFPPRPRATEVFPHPEFPLIVQLRARSAGAAIPAGAALSAIGAGAARDVMCETVHGGIDIYAASEGAAQDAITVLRASLDAAAFDVFAPEVRYWPGRPVREPVMSVDLEMPLVFGTFVRREVLRRRGRVSATEPGRRSVTLRGEAPLAALLGFGRWLDALTDGRARCRTALLRYAPLGNNGSPDPGPLAA